MRDRKEVGSGSVCLDVIEGNTFGQELLERSGDLLEVTQEA